MQELWGAFPDLVDPDEEKKKIERHDDWETPNPLWQDLNQVFQFELDAAANAQNAKCPLYYTEQDDALKQNWRTFLKGGALHSITSVWVNPPYKKLMPWVNKANQESLKGCTVVMLLPNSRDTSWFHDIIVPAKLEGRCRTYSYRGRIRFEDPHPGAKRQAPKQGNMLVVFTPPMPECWALD